MHILNSLCALIFIDFPLFLIAQRFLPFQKHTPLHTHTHRKIFTNNLCVHKSMHIAMLLISTLCELTSYWNVHNAHRTPHTAQPNPFIHSVRNSFAFECWFFECIVESFVRLMCHAAIRCCFVESSDLFCNATLYVICAHDAWRPIE